MGLPMLVVLLLLLLAVVVVLRCQPTLTSLCATLQAVDRLLPAGMRRWQSTDIFSPQHPITLR